MSVESLPSYGVKARNTSAHSENKIHDDAVARQYGFRGGLVPGVTVYAYLTEPLVAAFGAAWLQRGTASVRFHKPVFDGEELTVAGDVTAEVADQRIPANRSEIGHAGIVRQRCEWDKKAAKGRK